MKTFIRRPGNKTRYLKHILPLVPGFSGKYIEPFIGTGAVYLSILPKNAILNDLNTNIANVWKLVKTDPGYIIEEVNKFKISFLALDNQEKLKLCRDITRQIDAYQEKYKIVMYLTMLYCSFNACVESRFSSLLTYLSRKNSCHIFTEEYSQKLMMISPLLKNTKIYNKDYKDILYFAKKDDFVFLDPPYIEDKNYDFVYNKEENFDLEVLVSECKKLDKKKVKWMMTQIDTSTIREMFKGYRMVYYNNTGNFNNSKKLKHEVIIMNY